MNRRGFLGSILALGAAPAIVRADSLMRIVPRETLVYAHVTYGMGYEITESGLANVLWPGVQGYYGDVYAGVEAVMAAARRTRERIAYEVLTRGA